MALVPFTRRHQGELARLHNEMDDLFGSFFRGLERPFTELRVWPPVDIAEKEDKIVVRAEVAGCKPEDIDISVHGDTLTLSGEKKETRREEDKGYFHVESCYGNFRRELTLPMEVDRDKIEATCKDGVLSITLPKAEKTKAVKIQVKG